MKSKQRKHTETKQAISAKRKVKTKPVKPSVKNKRQKRTEKKQAKRNVYKPSFIVTPTRENLSFDEEQFNSDEDQFSVQEEQHTFNANQPNSLARRHFNEDQLNSLARRQRFGPKVVYE